MLSGKIALKNNYYYLHNAALLILIVGLNIKLELQIFLFITVI